MIGVSNISVDISGDLDAAKGISDIPKKVLRAQVRAVSSMRRKLGTEAKRDIALEYNLKAGRIAQGLQFRIVADGLALRGSSQGINAINFGATWTRTRHSKHTAGARYKFKRSEGIAEHAGTFIAHGINSSARLVFKRDTKRAPHRMASGVNAGRLKQYLLAVYGPSVAQMLKHGDRPQRLVDFAIRIVDAEVKRQLALAGAAA